MILQIDVTVTGPDQVMTGSVAVTVNTPAAGPAPAAKEEPILRAQDYSRSMRWGQR